VGVAHVQDTTFSLITSKKTLCIIQASLHRARLHCAMHHGCAKNMGQVVHWPVAQQLRPVRVPHGHMACISASLQLSAVTRFFGTQWCIHGQVVLEGGKAQHGMSLRDPAWCRNGSVPSKLPVFLLQGPKDASAAPLELSFMESYGSIAQHLWFGDGYVLLGFRGGQVVVVSSLRCALWSALGLRRGR
jgi:hypothetical protein